MLYISEVNWRITCLLLSFSILNKAESSQMSALCFKLFRLSYSVLTFKSLKAKIHLLSWNHLLFICIICTFLDADQKHNRKSAWRARYMFSTVQMPVTIRKCVAFVWLCYHIKYILLTKTLRNCHGCLLVFFLPLDLFFYLCRKLALLVLL